MGAIVFRVITEPQIRTEYLDQSGDWSEHRPAARIYPSYEEAEGVAIFFRHKSTEVWTAAALTESAIQHVMIRHDHDNAPTGFVMPQPRRPLTRAQRAARRREEMRQDDLRELEQVEIYG